MGRLLRLRSRWKAGTERVGGRDRAGRGGARREHRGGRLIGGRAGNTGNRSSTGWLIELRHDCRPLESLATGRAAHWRLIALTHGAETR